MNTGDYVERKHTNLTEIVRQWNQNEVVLLGDRQRKGATPGQFNSLAGVKREGWVCRNKSYIHVSILVSTPRHGGQNKIINKFV